MKRAIGTTLFSAALFASLTVAAPAWSQEETFTTDFRIEDCEFESEGRNAWFSLIPGVEDGTGDDSPAFNTPFSGAAYVVGRFGEVLDVIEVEVLGCSPRLGQHLWCHIDSDHATGRADVRCGDERVEGVDPIECVGTHQQPHRGRDLVVTRARGMEPLAGVADELCQAALDVEVYVLRIDRPLEGTGADLVPHLRETALDRLLLTG